ncbi:hypothetical protein H1R20_g5900, partial [Candolleomyces eurysporus]
MSSVRALEFYSGIGGLHHALSNSRPDAQVLKAYDWDPTSCQVYSANFPGPISSRQKDISALTAAELADLNANLWLMSPACQPYTVLNPQAKGAADPRAQSFLHVVQTVLPELAQTDRHPSYILVENVAGFETSTTRQELLRVLRSIGYNTLELLLTPLQYGIPNSRLRYYLLARKRPLEFPKEDKVWRHIPGLPEESDAEVTSLKHYLDSEVDGGRRVPDKILTKWGRLFDIVLPSSKRTCCFTRGYTHMVERTGSILQETEELDTTTVFNEFMQAQSEGKADAIEILHRLRLRYFTPSELLRIFAFDERSFVWPPSVSTKTKYRLIGNSVNVRVVQELISYLLNHDN